MFCIQLSGFEKIIDAGFKYRIANMYEFKVGLELSGIRTSDRARGSYLLRELQKLGFIVEAVTEQENVDVRIMLKRDLCRDKRKGEVRIFDVSDAILIPPADRSLLKIFYQRVVVNRRYGRFLSQCNAVVVACRTQKKSIERYNKNVYMIPDSSYYHTLYDKNKKPDASDKVVFVWDGQGINFQYLETIVANNISFFQKQDVLLKVVTDRVDRLRNVDIKEKLSSFKINVEFKLWDADTFMQEVNAAHVGLAPVDLKCPHASAKPDNKLVNYQGLGLVAIASATMAYSDFASHSGGGVIDCKTDMDWTKALEYWRVSRSKINELGMQGRKYVINNYTPEALAKLWQEVIHAVTCKY